MLTVYTRFADADRRFRADNIDRLFAESPAGRAGLDSALAIFTPDGHVRGNHVLVEPVLQYLQTTNRTSGQDVMDTFAKAPYGWPGDLLRYVAAALFVDGRVAVTDRAGKRYDDSTGSGRAPTLRHGGLQDDPAGGRRRCADPRRGYQRPRPAERARLFGG